jgi:hypothetical protein
MLEGKIDKMEMDKMIKEDLKTVALGTSKINYLDPRITVAWCKRHEVPIEKVHSFWFWTTFVLLQVSLLQRPAVTESAVLLTDFQQIPCREIWMGNGRGPGLQILGEHWLPCAQSV